jgi:hypothetical protein
MKKQTLPILLACAALSPLCLAQSTSQREIQKMYDDVTRLGISLNIEKLVKSFVNSADKSFVYIDAQKNSFALENFVEQMRRQYKSIENVKSITNKIVSFKINGKQAICQVKSTYDMTIAGIVPTRVNGWSKSSDIWIKTVRGWKLKSTAMIAEEAFKNGKKVKA